MIAAVWPTPNGASAGSSELAWRSSSGDSRDEIDRDLFESFCDQRAWMSADRLPGQSRQESALPRLAVLGAGGVAHELFVELDEFGADGV